VRPVPEAVEGALAPGQALDDQLRVAVDDDRHYFTALITIQSSTILGPLTWAATSSRTLAASSAEQPARVSHGSSSIGCRIVSTSSTVAAAAVRNATHHSPGE